MAANEKLTAVLIKHQSDFYKAIPFNDGSDRLLSLDFTENNKELTKEILDDTDKFSEYISQQLIRNRCRYGIGGYAEHRTIYNRSSHFDSIQPGEEPRRLHLGIDIWGEAGTSVIAPLEGTIHSVAFNNNFGDYGATIILTHNLDGITFHTLYGHLSLDSLKNRNKGDLIKAGKVFAAFGTKIENGHWPPHLHFQLIVDMQGWRGDYPGVCKYSEKEMYLDNCPDPELILCMEKHVILR